MRSSILDHHCPLLHHWASHCCWKKIHSTFTWIEALWGTHFSVTVLFSLVNIQNLFHTLPSSFLCRGSFAFHFTKIVHSDLDSVISISLYYMTFLDSLNVFWVIFFRCGIFWFPTLTLPLVCAPPPPDGLIISVLSWTHFVFPTRMPLFPPAVSAHKRRWNSSKPFSFSTRWESWKIAHTIGFL